ncbi:cysteine-rich motor neuron 1 protein-like isoform X2 [Sinocyclocheilus anshuiensis]|uniref:cysteine-rich motor neuron 1 protein-like isoform X2 n=1 Tax=Sinocyclocheilus anshuiensis TaxID=1608454 RepID=UPI0007BABACA|nr:PREDICTED: cysteine-rich motor neuron 1 protein-like isoform X2 [Sinocyclocheilus anshuiensis]
MCPQSLLWLLGVLGFCARALGARECVPCGSARVLARDPCGCCERCSRLELELCGGPDWTLGYCGSGLTCAALNGTGPARIPETGVCRAVPDATDADEHCPLVSGCESVDGECVCESKHSCIQTYSFPNRDACVHAGKTGSLRHEHRHRLVGPVNPACVFSGCNLTADGCVCSSQSCDDHFTYANRSQCQRAAVSPRCVHNGKEFTEGEVYRMDPCWLCQCRVGVSFCSKAECAELDCENFYVPEGECCPVCIDVELLSVESTKASCWVNHRLRAHEEQWKDDDCTFCQCVDGEPHCTAMACKQSCQNPVKIPGECCPFCEEPSYETVSPLLCPPLENCSLSGHDCPFGFQQDPSGCLLCQCVSDETCPDVSTYCSLECPLGYEKDNYGCEVCECSVSAPKCRPMTCSKTCPYGYMRNKHGCEMCRCVRCPPFTCDKHCGGGFRKSRKGCSVCECEDADSTSASITVSSSFCLTASGQRFEDGDGWHDGCRDCFCHAGREMCVLITCSVPTCTHPVLHPNQCCPGCEDESGSGQPEGLDLVVCRAPGGELFVEGETWRLDECTSCTCRLGRVLCDSEACPPVLCHTPVRSRDGCCYVCPEDKLETLRPEFCVSSSGEILQAGDSWKPNACSSCVCRNGSVQCFSQQCPAADCRVPVLRKGQCCPQCMLEITNTSVPVMLSTAVTESRITAAPPVLAVTDGEGLSRDVPSQTQMTLIYQSAAWILAGILLAVVIFLLVAILVNRRKNWVQMSCYGAPKKTVILQKHVNKSSLVYMEPSRENQFQSLKSDGSVSFPTDASKEQISIPRAKLASGHVER